MASVSTYKNGTRAVLVICPDGQRRPIRLGRATKDVALEVKRHVEHLLAHRRYGLPLPGSTAEWVNGVRGRLRKRLALCGLAAAAPVRRVGQGHLARPVAVTKEAGRGGPAVAPSPRRAAGLGPAR